MIKNLIIFKSLFRGREDAFALRWERDGKSGYVPAYNINWNEYSAHKAKGGNLKNFADKQYALLTDERITNHLNGKEIIGIYPLLKDNTSWFIAADFDQSTTKGQTWIDECYQFVHECEKYHLPVYLERSRSGKGGHVWMFFNAPYPALKSRRIFLHILTSSGIIAGKSSNFDRLFPNQDYHSGMELGNLIALPFQKKALEQNNSCFINPVTLEPFADHLEFLKSVQTVSTSKLDQLFSKIEVNSSGIDTQYNDSDGKINIILNNQIVIPRPNLNGQLYRYLRDHLNIKNNDFFIKKNTGKNTYNTEAILKTLEEKDNELVLPRGFIGKLLRHCKEQNISYEFTDERKKLEAIKFNSSVSLYDYQESAINSTNKKDFGVIVAPPGSGKTVIGLSIVAQKEQPALIIVHRKQLFDQWIERIQSFLKIPKHRIGRIEGGKYTLGEEITVAMIQSLQSNGLQDNIYKSFGSIIVDECHHVPAETFSQVINWFHSYFLYGLTATPYRKNKDEKLIFIYIGDIIHEVTIPSSGAHNKQLSINIKDTDFFAPFNSGTDSFETFLHILIYDTARNELIINDIKKEVAAGRKVLVLTERKAHIEVLNQYLKNHCETIILTGNDKEQNRKVKLKQIEEGSFQVLLSTGQFIGEGTDIAALDCLVLAYPFSFEGKLIQYIGRVQRSIVTPVIYDYKDYRIDYLNDLFKQRNKHYRKLIKAGQIKKFEELTLLFKETSFTINASVEFSISCLDLPLPVEKFNCDITWKLRVIDFDEDSGELLAEIIDYNSKENAAQLIQTSFYYNGSEKIKFRSLDTGNFLKLVILKKQNAIEVTSDNNIITNESPIEHVVLKTMKVPLWKIRFMYGSVSFPVYIEDLQQELVFEIVNADMRPEFEVIKEYFAKVLKRKLIKVEIAVIHTATQILSATAKSENIDSINNNVIESVRFEFVKRQILKPIPGTTVTTIENLLGQHKESKILYSSEQQVIDDILNVKKSKHFLQLKYLSSAHQASILKLRFVLQPFSFLFLLLGETKYHLVWETLDSEEATYIWHIQKTREALRTAIAEIEIILNEIRQTGRENFLEKEATDFSRIIHDYSDAKKGFITWKSIFEERLI